MQQKTKEIDKAAKVVKNIAADRASKIEVITGKLAEQKGKLTSNVYKICHEESRKPKKNFETYRGYRAFRQRFQPKGSGSKPLQQSQYSLPRKRAQSSEKHQI